MKRIFNLAMTAALAVGVVSCSKDSTDNMGTNPEAQLDNKLTFVLPNAASAKTYSLNDVTASDAEKELDLSKTTIFMFDASGELEEIVAGSAATPGISGVNQTVSIDIDESWSTGAKTFYFIGNNTSASGLPTSTTPTVTASDFCDLVTVSQGTTLLSTPLLLAGYELVPDVTKANTVDVNLYRSVARFDIDHDVTASNDLVIEGIYIDNANLQGYVMGRERSNTHDTGNTVEIASGIATGKLEITAIDAPDANNLQQQESAFYTYPMILKANASSSEAAMYVSVKKKDGSSEIFRVNKVNGTTGDAEDITIEANRRYKISATYNPVDGKVMFVLIVSDWDNGDSMMGTPDASGNNFGFAVNPAGAAVASYSNGIVSVVTAGGQMTFTVMASSSKGTSWALAPVGANDDSDCYTVSESASTSVTYAAPYYASTYTIDVAGLTAGEGSTTKLTITDKANPANVIELRFFHKGDDNALTTVADVITNNDALKTVLEEDLGLKGDITTDELDAITELDLSNKDITSLDDINKLSNLTVLNASENADLKEVDLTGLGNLEILNLANTGVTEIELSATSKLTALSLSNTNVSEIDLSTCPNLVSLNLERTNITELDLSNNLLLEIISISNTAIKPSTIDFASLTKLKRFAVDGVVEATVDFSTSTSLELIFVNNSPKLTKAITGASLKEIFLITCPNLENVDVTKSPLLTSLKFGNCPVASLDLSNNTELLTLEINKTAITVLDISNCTKLSRLIAQNMPNTMDIYVWGDFDTVEPKKSIAQIALHYTTFEWKKH